MSKKRLNRVNGQPLIDRVPSSELLQGQEPRSKKMSNESVPEEECPLQSLENGYHPFKPINNGNLDHGHVRVPLSYEQAEHRAIAELNFACHRAVPLKSLRDACANTDIANNIFIQLEKPIELRRKPPKDEMVPKTWSSIVLEIQNGGCFCGYFFTCAKRLKSKIARQEEKLPSALNSINDFMESDGGGI